MISLISVIIAIILLIFLIYRRVHLIPATLLCLLILSLGSNIPFHELTMDHYAVSLSGFIARYFLVFVTNALFGKVMEETLLISGLSRLIGKWFGDRNAAYGALIVTMILSYGGVSAFVIVFTVYPLFLSTFRKADLPRKLIPAGIMAATCTFPLSMLPGGAQLNNVIPVSYLGTTPMAAPWISLAASIVSGTFLFLYFRHCFQTARKRGDHFATDEKVLEQISRFDRDSGLKPWAGLLPMALIIVLINVFHMELAYAVACGTLLALGIGWKNLPDKLETMNQSMNKVGPAMVTTAVSVGFGGAILACPGAETILNRIASLPFNPAVSLALASSFAGILTGNGGGGADVAMRILSQPYLAMGVRPELLHRIAAIATAGFSCLPHNGMLITVCTTCGFSIRESYVHILISTVLVSLCGLIVTVLLGCL